MDMEAFQRAAKYTLVKYTDMHIEMKEEAMDICITAVEKYTTDIEKCTQVSDCALGNPSKPQGMFPCWPLRYCMPLACMASCSRFVATSENFSLYPGE